ncbi:hypothetical protein [Humidisolicoccus flavus]|uniref:hypothetical protein n=1 Tax=Humidisolicoccus flavus TaxID=3111414 RepID=UPI00324B95B3
MQHIGDEFSSDTTAASTESQRAELHEHASEALHDALIRQLDLIEAQPLEERAAGFAQLHDQLQAKLEMRS